MKWGYKVLQYIVLLLIMSCANNSNGKQGKDQGGKKEETPTLEINGFYNSISPNSRLILYKKSFEGEEGEYNLGKLLVFDVKTKQHTEIADTIDINTPDCLFYNDSIILIPTSEKVLTYDINTKKSTVLIKTEENQIIQSFSLSIDKKKIAAVIIDYDKKEAFLLLYSIQSNEKTIIKSTYDFEDTNEYPSSLIYWVNTGVIYAVQNNLYHYQFGKNTYNLISKKLKYNKGYCLYAVDNTECTFVEYGNEIKKYIIKEGVVRSVNEYLKKEDQKEADIYLYSGIINNHSRIFARVNGKIFSTNDSGMKTLNNITIYKDRGIEIYLSSRSNDTFNIISFQ